MNQENAKVRDQVRSGYAGVAERASSSTNENKAEQEAEYAKKWGYSDEEISHIPEEANLGLSCGNPTALASLRPGEVVLDLGSGAGMDAFLAAQAVTSSGRVIGVDMTPEMLGKARKNAVKVGVETFVEFREGYIEDLPINSDSIDVILSNCVINLSPDIPQVFRESYRALKPGGRLAVSDICLSQALPSEIMDKAEAYIVCVSGALLADDYINAIKDAGFQDVRWTRNSASVMLDQACADPLFADAIASLDGETISEVASSIWSYKIEATKPES